jgi:hypothetical protein
MAALRMIVSQKILDVLNDVGKIISELFRIHARINRGHIPMWEGFVMLMLSIIISNWRRHEK